MTTTQLTAAIETAQKAKDFETVGLLYRELRARRAGKPTREIIEATSNMTDRELIIAIQGEKNSEKQSMLYKRLVARRARE